MIPGTFGSIAGLLIYIFLSNNSYLLFLVTCVIVILGFLLSGKSAKLYKRRDPACIVIDELSGMLISFLGLPVNRNLALLLAGFIIFRSLDVIKVYPAGWFQRREGSLGIMSDDLVAGIYTNLILRVLSIFLL